MKPIDQLTVKYRDRIVGTLSLTPDSRACAFAYDNKWLIDGFSISPLELPLKTGVFVAKPEPFAGNFGVFEDSMPDGYGRYLLHKALLKEGVNDFELSSLQRLSIIGNNGMGALTYTPVNNIITDKLTDDFDFLQLKALEVLKELQDDDVNMLLFNSGNSGGARPKAVFSDDSGHWLVKFRHYYDPEDFGLQEYHYNEVASRCGLNLPDFKLVNGKYFASRRFDIDDSGERVHTVTAGGILCVSLSTPVLDYTNLMALTGYITQNRDDVEELFRRMIFNYIAGNKDDHCKNFSFMVVEKPGSRRWRLAPAYDLTFCEEGYNGQHATSVNGKSNPKVADFISIGKRFKINEHRCREIINQVISNIGDIQRYEI